MKLIVITFALLVVGCDYDRLPSPHDFKCNNEQIKEMMADVEACTESNYYASYCYSMAKSLYCEDIRK